MLEDQVVREINALNQRGGRMLSMVDLLLAGTVDLKLAAYLMGAIRQGASVLCCAGPGGTGKTTLLGALLGFLPRQGVIKVVEKAEPLKWYTEQSDPELSTWFVCHELGPGPWYSYLWGEGARSFLSMPHGGRFCATTVHADDLGELRRLLLGSEIALSAEDFSRLDLVIFIRVIRVQGAMRWQRRVTQVHVGTGDPRSTHRPVCRWDAKADKFVWQEDGEPLSPVPTDVTVGSGSTSGSRSWLPSWGLRTARPKWDGGKSGPARQSNQDFLRHLQDKRILALEDVRREVLRFYET